MIEPAPVVSDSVAEKKPAKKTDGDATATEKWPFEWLPFGMQE